MRHATGLAAALIVFVVLATANSGGYRYGISDQAYYGPAVVKSLHPSFYPRDASLLAVQSRYLLSDDLVAWLARASGVELPTLFVALYVLTLGVLFAASVAFARGLGASWWGVAAFVVLLTLRHRIAKTGANSLEGYMHPRMLAFAIGLAALSCVLRARLVWAAVLVALAGVIHPTTALWFGLALTVGVVASRPEWRRRLWPAAATAAVVVAWMLWRGPLAGRLQVMDADWLRVLADRDYLFPSAWPLYAWLVNLAYPVVIVLAYRHRRALGVTVAGERAVVTGMIGLVAVFLASVPFSAARIALVVQLQVNRVFWLTDSLATAYLAWWVMDRWLAGRQAWARRACVSALVALAALRGCFLLCVQTDRPLFQVSLPQTPWSEAMAWLRQQPPGWHVLAAPDHVWKYGVSARFAAEKDTLLELGKDPSIAMYDRDVARRVAERTAALAGFDRFTTSDVRVLQARYDLDVLVVEAGRVFDFPVTYRNTGIVVYALR